MLKKLYVMLEKLECFDEFKKFKKDNPDSYLVSAFFMTVNKDDDVNWQADFYSPEKHTIASFVIKGEDLEVKQDQEVFQKDKEKLNELELDNVKIDFDEVLQRIDELKDKKYPGETPNKIIVLLQTIHNEAIWNITYLTNTFNVWNIKVSASGGEIKSEKMESILSFKAKPQ